MISLKLSMLLASMEGNIKDASFEFKGWRNNIVLFAKPDHPNTWLSIQWTTGSSYISIECHRMAYVKDSNIFYMDLYAYRKRMLKEDKVTVFTKHISNNRPDDVNEKLIEWISDIYDNMVHCIEKYGEPTYLKLPESYGEPSFIYINSAVYPVHLKDALKVIKIGDLLLKPILKALTQGESN